MTRYPFMLLLVTLVGLGPAAGTEPFPIDPLWQSEEFRKAYTGSYGIDSRIEPLINEDETFYLNQAAARMATGDRPGAIEQLIESDLVENSPALMFSLGNFYFEEGDLETAIRYFRGAIRLFPNFRDAHRNLGMLLVRTGDLEAAEEPLKRALELGSQEGLTFGLLAMCHTQKDRDQAALAAYRMARVTMPDERQWKLGEAYALQNLGEPEKASSIYSELIDVTPGEGYLWVNRGYTFVNKGDTGKAIADLEVARRMGALSPSNHAVLARLYRDEDLFAMAMKNYRVAFAKRGISLVEAVSALEYLAIRNAWDEAGEVGELIGKYLDDELRRNEDVLIRSSYERALALLSVETGDAVAAGDRIESWLEREPTDGPALLLLARIQRDEGKAEEAIVLLEQAAAFSEGRTRAAALLLHGQLLVDQGRYGEAVEKLRESNQILPSANLARYISSIEELAAE